MLLFVGMGGIFGAITRFILGRWITSKTSNSFPYGTWTINITGSFILGMLAVLYLSGEVPEWVWFLFGIGFLGSYTTFSTFGYETMELIQKKKLRKAVLYVTTSIALGVLFAWIGGWIALVYG